MAEEKDKMPLDAEVAQALGYDVKFLPRAGWSIVGAMGRRSAIPRYTQLIEYAIPAIERYCNSSKVMDHQRGWRMNREDLEGKTAYLVQINYARAAMDAKLATAISKAIVFAEKQRLEENQ